MKTLSLNNHTTKVIKLDHQMGDLKKELTLNAGYEEFLVDLTDVSFLTRKVLNALIEIKKQWPDQYRKVKLLNPGGVVRNLLALNKLDRIYEIQEIYPTAW